MKLYQFVISSNNDVVALKDSHFAETFELKSIYVLNSADLTEDLMQVEIDFIAGNTNVHTTEDRDLIIVPLDKTANSRKSKKHYETLFRNIDIPRQFRIKLYDENGDPFDNAKLGKVLITFESDST